jgi:protein-arginine kinase activator protein McsA
MRLPKLATNKSSKLGRIEGAHAPSITDSEVKMGCPIPVHCQNCNEPLDVYVPRSERFCCEECYDEFHATHPGEIEREEAIEARAP